MENKTSIIIIDKTEESLERILKLLKNISDIEILQTSTDIEEIKYFIKQKTPHIIIMGPSFSLNDIEYFQKVNGTSFGLLKTILFTKDTSPEAFKKAMRLNIFDIIEFPFSYNDLKESLNRAKVAITESTVGGAHVLAKKPVDSEKPYRNIMVFGTKGGSGKSFIAANLAIDLHKKSKKNVVLADLNHASGDIALMLDTYPKHTTYDISSIIQQLDQEMLNSFLTPHSSGIKILPAPINPTHAESVTAKVTLKIMDILTYISDYIVIDTPGFFAEDILAILDKVDVLCMVASMEIPSIKSLKVALEVLEQLKFPKEKIVIIVNRANSKVGLTWDEIENTISAKINITIPSDRIVPMTINMGKPVILNNPNSPVSKNINKLTKLIMGMDKAK